MKTTLRLAVACVAVAAIVAPATLLAQITNPFSSTGYASTNKDWLSETATDIDGNGLGTDGFIFFGDFQPGNAGSSVLTNVDDSNIFGANAAANASLFTVLQPSYITDAATDFASDNVLQFDYEPIDSPVALDGTDEVAGNLRIVDTSAALNFTVAGLAADTTVRVGVLGAVLNDIGSDARFDAPTISLTDGTVTSTVTGLPNLSGSTIGTLGWVFFDIDTDGIYSISVPPDFGNVDPDVTGLGGVTFDSFVVVPEPSSLAFLGLAGMGMFTRRRK